MNLSTRIFLSLTIVLLVVAAGLWIIGGKKNEYATETTINASPESVFPYLTQAGHMKKWVSGLTNVEDLTPLKENDNGVRGGKKTLRVVKDDEGNQTRYDDEVIRFEDGKAVSVQSTNSSEKVTRIFQLDLNEGKTVLNYRVKTENAGIGRMTAVFQKNDYGSQIESEARKLKELVEANEPEPAPVEPIYQNPSFESP